MSAKFTLITVDLFCIHYSSSSSPIWQDVVPVCFAGDGLLVVDPLAAVAVPVLELELEAAVTSAEELVEGVERVIKAAVLSVVMPLSGIGVARN